MLDNTTTRLRALANELRDHKSLASDLEERLKQENERIREIATGEMVDLMNTMDVTSYAIAADGNTPAFEFELGHHYGASISREWEEPRREAAFEALPEELIKVTVKCIFAKGEYDVASELAEELVTAGYTVQLDKEVHHSTLKAWVRERFENGEPLPDLPTIGAVIFQEVKIKEVKP